MRSYRPYLPNMVQALTVLTVLKMMTKAQTTCGNGAINGRILYERLPNIQLQGFDDDIVRDTSTPFMVLEKCEDLCLRDRASNNIVRTCTSFDFQPGSRISAYNGGPEYEESTCYLTAEQARPEGIGSLMLVPNSVHFTEICLSSKRPDRECPNRKYVFERHPKKKLKLQSADMKESTASNRTECEDKCLDEFSFICRSATFDSARRTCILSRFTRRTHPELLEDDPDSDYLENTCLSSERRCDGLAVFIKEENKRLGGPFEVDQFTNMTLEDCQTMCVRAEKYFCRSIEYDEMTKQCTLSEEDSVSQKDEIGVASSPTHHYYDFVCLDSPHGQEYPDNPITSHLFSGKKPDTAFQRYRNSRLGGEHHSEISGRSLSECLDECLRQPSFQCRSAEYSERYRTCRLTRYNQRDGMRIIYDADYDYYENLMLGGDDQQRPGGDNGMYRPDDDRYPNRDRYRPGSGGRYPPYRGGGGRYPAGGDDWYSGGRPQWDDRNNIYSDDGFYRPGGGGGGGRYPMSGGRYPNEDPDRYPYYPSGGDTGRYPNQYPLDLDGYSMDRPRDRPGGQGMRFRDRDYYFYGSRYGGDSIRYGNGGNRYNDRYGGHRYGGNRYGNKYGANRHQYNYAGDDKNDGNRYYYRPDRRPGGRPVDGLPTYEVRPIKRPISPGPDGPIYDNVGGAGVLLNKPSYTRCDEGDHFKQMASRQRMRKEFVRRFITVPSLHHCERECTDSRDFMCRSFNFREGASKTTTPGFDSDRDNCELSDRDSRELEVNNPRFFDKTTNYDYYERSISRQGVDSDCVDVSQVCNEDGMEFTLRTPEGFYGRIYTYGYYDRCFFRGNGGTINVLRISGTQGYPDCGTQRYGDTMTNIAVVQFSDYVQTNKDKRFNLTCLFRGPGEAIVSSGFIGAGSGSPTPIEYLPAENTLSSKVRLMILYQGRPTTTIAVGDPLTFRLEAQDGYNYATDIFASNVVARDPYSGRSVQLIDRYGCPVDSFVFPELDRGRSGDSLEARFNAFKIPESNFLVFEATVKTCREGCQPAYCQGGSGRSEPSFGRRKREVANITDQQYKTVSNITNSIIEESNKGTEQMARTDVITEMTVTFVVDNRQLIEKSIDREKTESEEPEFVREMIEVFDSREELQLEARKAEPVPQTICLTSNEYNGLITAILCMLVILLTMALMGGIAYRRYWHIGKNKIFIERPSSNMSTSTSFLNSSTRSLSSNANSFFGSIMQKPFNSLGKSAKRLGFTKNLDDSMQSQESINRSAHFNDPSEPIYTDASFFDKSRSLRSIAVSPNRQHSIISQFEHM